MKVKLTPSGNLIIYKLCSLCGREYNTDRKTHAIGRAFRCNGQEIIKREGF